MLFNSSGEITLQQLTEIQARVLGCLMEKKETTPEQYPLTLNSLRLACNQKTARQPVTSYSEGEVGHAVRELIAMGYAREAWGARVAKYEHDAGKALGGLHSKALALLCPLMLRGPQTLAELKTNAHRLHEFDDLDDVSYALQRLEQHEPPLVVTLPRQPGQKELRHAHLLCGEPQVPEVHPGQRPEASRGPAGGAAADGTNEQLQEQASQIQQLEQRISQLEDALEQLRQRLDGAA